MGLVSNFMKIFNKTDEIKEPVFNNYNDLLDLGNSGGVLNDVTYYVCLKILSEAISKLSIHLYDKNNNRVHNHPVTQLLNVRPNEFMTPSTFKQVLEFNRNHKGNSYIYIEYNKGIPTSLYPLKSENVSIITNTDTVGLPKLLYKVQLGSKNYLLLPHEIIHLKAGLSDDGIQGKSVISTLKTTFSINKQGDKFLEKSLKSGFNPKALINVSQTLNKEKREQLLEIVMKDMKTNSNRELITVPDGITLTPFNFKMTDSQFYELKQYNATQIASAFGISPIYLNDYSKSSYSNSESQNLSFYIDTMLSILKQYEEELNYKLLTDSERLNGMYLQFNLNGVLRGDLKTQAEAIRTLVSSGVYQINEARVFLGMPKIEKGDVNLINGTYTKIEDIGKAYD